jgi:hypothetical protein
VYNINGNEIQLKRQVVEMLDLYNRIYRENVDMDYKFIVVALIGVMNNVTANINKKFAYDFIMMLYKYRVENDGFRMSYFTRYFQNGIKVAIATTENARQNRRNRATNN